MKLFPSVTVLTCITLVGCSKYPKACWPDIRCLENCIQEGFAVETCERMCEIKTEPLKATASGWTYTASGWTYDELKTCETATGTIKGKVITYRRCH